MSEPDWKAIVDGSRNPLFDALSGLDFSGHHAALMVIGWKLGVVTAEDLEIHLMESHSADQAAERRAAVKLYDRIIRRLREQLDHEVGK